jgi:hypothetical protein
MADHLVDHRRLGNAAADREPLALAGPIHAEALVTTAVEYLHATVRAGMEAAGVRRALQGAHR